MSISSVVADQLILFGEIICLYWEKYEVQKYTK